MKKPLFLLASLFFSALNILGQADHQTADNIQANWSDPAAWVVGDGNINPTEYAAIYGTITYQGDLILDGGRSIDVWDTLVVTGNLSADCAILPPYSLINIRGNGVLIVLGDMVGDHSAVNVSGDMIVVGEVDVNNLIVPPLLNTGHVYLYDDDPVIDPFFIGDPTETEDDIPSELFDFLDHASCLATDNEPPTTTACPSDIVVNAVTGSCSAVVTYSEPVFVDNCDGTGLSGTRTYGPASGSSFPVGSTTVTYTYNDEANNGPVNCTFTITVIDNELPTISLPAIPAIQCASNVPAPYSNYTALVAAGGSASDNCGIETASFTHVSDISNGLSCPEVITRTYSIEDNAGNVQTATQLITIDDNTNPTASNPAPINVQCMDDVPDPDISVVTDEADNCTANPTVTHQGDVNNSGAGCGSDPYIITRTYRITDDCGNYTDVTQTITVEDNTNPTASNPAPINFQCMDGVPDPDISVVTDEADNCTANPTVTHQGDVNNGGAGCGGDPYIITRTYRITDDCGNYTDVTQTITVEDNTNPTASNPAPVAVQCMDGVPDPDISVVTDEADNCTANPTVTHQGDVNNGGAGCGSDPYIISRTYRITDDCGNYTDVTQTITVEDNTNPTASNPAPVAVQCMDDIPDPDINVVIDEADNCTATPTVTHQGDVNNGGAGCGGEPYIIIRTYRITDDCGNYTDVTQTITVEDNTNPTASNPAPVTVQCIDDIPEPNINVVIDEADNCTATPTVTYQGDVSNGGAGSSADPLIIQRNYRVSDDCGNYIDLIQTITVEDALVPTITAPGPINTTTDANSCLASGIDLGTPVTADNCSVDSLTNNAPLNFGVGTTQVIWTVTDEAGNSATALQEVTVTDEQNPEITCPGNIAVCAMDATGITLSDLAPIDLSDNCNLGLLDVTYTISGATSASGDDDASGTYFNVGSSVLSYTVRDESNNEASCTSDITVFAIPITSDISGNTTPDCFGTEDYSVIGSTDSKYHWTVPDGATIQTDTSSTGVSTIEVDFGSSSGIITVQEVNANGCAGEVKSLNVNLTGCDIIADFDINKSDACPNEIITVLSTSSGVSSAANYEWNFGSNAQPGTATGPGPHEVSYATAGDKQINLIVTDGSTETVSKSVTIHEIPDLSLETNDRCGSGNIIFTATLISGDRVYFSTDGGNTISFTDNSSPFEYAVQVEEGDSVTVWAKAGDSRVECEGNWSVGITGRALLKPTTQPIISENPGTDHFEEVCRGETRHYSIQPINNLSYNWKVPDLGITETNTNEITVKWDVEEGLYLIEVQAESSNGCKADPRNASVYVSDPYLELGPDIAVCKGTATVLEPIDEWTSYSWSKGENTSAITVSEAGTYSLTVSNAYNCEASDTINLIVYDNPAVDLGPDTTLCQDASWLLNIDGFMSYNWSTGDASSEIEIFPGAQTIWLEVQDENGCTGSDTLLISPCNPELLFNEIANTFTPNNDGVHDTWEITNIQLYPRAQILVFDRTGRVVFRSEGGYANDWKGTYDGKKLPMDTYYYVIDFNADDMPPRKGTVSIVR